MIRFYMLMKCVLGFHVWIYDELDNYQERMCIKCGKRQVWDYFGQDWSSDLLYLNDRDD